VNLKENIEAAINLTNPGQPHRIHVSLLKDILMEIVARLEKLERSELIHRGKKG
jgi:hypothetical protein